MTERVQPSHPPNRLNSAEPDKGHRLFLFLSVGVNLGLILFLILVYRTPASPPVSSTLPHGNTTHEARPISTPAKRFAARENVSPWAQLESSDLAIYAANLRAAGCPPKTVRDILLPDVEEKFKQPDEPVSEPTNFWASFSQRHFAAVAFVEQENVLRQQKDEALRELLDFAWTTEGLNQAYGGEAAGPLGFLDYDRAEKFLCIADRLKNQFSPRNRSHRIDDRLAIYQAWCKEVGAVISSAEFEETELREMLMIHQQRNPDLRNAGLSGSELRQLMTFRRELYTPLPSALLGGNDELPRETELRGERQFHAKARSLLGDNRFLDYLKHCDPSIERTLVAVEKEKLPRSLALELFDFRQEALARAEEIRQLPIRRAEKRVQLTTVRQSVLEQLAALTDGKTDSSLFQANEDWLQEIAHP